MGYNTVLVLLNDALTGIRNDPNFGDNLYLAVLHAIGGKRQDVPAGSYCNAVSIVGQDHADTYRCYIAGGNTAMDLGVVGHWSPYFRDNLNEQERKEMFLKNLADNLGFRVVRKRKKQ